MTRPRRARGELPGEGWEGEPWCLGKACITHHACCLLWDLLPTVVVWLPYGAGDGHLRSSPRLRTLTECYAINHHDPYHVLVQVGHTAQN